MEPQPSEAEMEDIADEVRHPIKATLAIYKRLMRISPEMAKLAQTSNWYQQSPWSNSIPLTGVVRSEHSGTLLPYCLLTELVLHGMNLMSTKFDVFISY